MTIVPALFRVTREAEVLYLQCHVLSQCIQQQKVRSAAIITFSQLQLSQFVCGPQFIFSVASTRGFPVTPDYASESKTWYEDIYHLACCIVICTSM